MKGTPSNELRLLRAFGAVASIALATRAAFALRDVLLAARFGAGDAIDELLAAASIPLFLGQTLGWAMGQAFLPAYARERQEHGEARAASLLRTASLMGPGLLGAVGLCAWLASPLLLPLVAGGFPEEKLQQARALALPLALLPGLAALAALWSAALTVRGREKAAAAVLLLTPLAECLLLGVARADVTLLAWLRPCAAVAELLLLRAALGDAWGLPSPPADGWREVATRLRPAAGQLGALSLAAGIGTLSVLVDQAMTAPLGTGAVAALGYGSKVSLGLLGLFDAALSAAVYPELARLSAAGDLPALRAAAVRWSMRAFAAALLACALLFALSEPFTRLLFERGRFGPADTLLVAQVQRWFVLQLPFHAAALVGTRLLSALSRSQALVLVSVVNVAVNASGNWLLRGPLGVAGIALSTAVVYLVAAVLTFFFCRAALRGPQPARA